MSVNIINAGTQIYVTSDGVTPDLTTTVSILFDYTDVSHISREVVIPAAAFIVLTSTLIIFNVPDSCSFTVTPIVVTLTGTEFSGTVTLGPNPITLINGSGIYEIVPGKTNDTLYVDSSVGSGTTDLKIPDPVAQFGYVGG